MELINEDLFKEESPIKSDTVIDDFVPYIKMAQRMYINKVLGKPLLTELETQIKQATENPDADPYPITPQNQALLKEIAPALSHYAVYQGIPFHWAALVNKGVTIRESENSRGVDVKDVGQLRRWLKDDAEFLLNQLIEYLCECKANYPLWRPGDYCGGCGCDDSKPKQTIDTGIWIPKRRRR